MNEPCDGCGESVKIGGSEFNLWTFQQESTGGITLELADGSEFFLCYSCIERLPDDKTVTTEDVEALEDE